MTSRFLTTFTLVPLARASRRSCCSALTVVPWYLAITVILELPRRSATSWTTSSFFVLVRAIDSLHYLLVQGSTVALPSLPNKNAFGLFPRRQTIKIDVCTSATLSSLSAVAVSGNLSLL